MGFKPRSSSRFATRRSLRAIEKRKKEQNPPKGKGGGEEGVIRGRISEEKTNEALRFMKSSGKIFHFVHITPGSETDKKKVDFIIFVEKKKKKRCQRFALQVKSSERMMLEHREKSFVPVINVNDDDSIFVIAEKIESVLHLS